MYSDRRARKLRLLCVKLAIKSGSESVTWKAADIEKYIKGESEPKH